MGSVGESLHFYHALQIPERGACFGTGAFGQCRVLDLDSKVRRAVEICTIDVRISSSLKVRHIALFHVMGRVHDACSLVLCTMQSSADYRWQTAGLLGLGIQSYERMATKQWSLALE